MASFVSRLRDSMRYSTKIRLDRRGSGSSSTDPSARLISILKRLYVWPLGSGSAPISPTWYRPVLLDRIAGSIAST